MDRDVEVEDFQRYSEKVHTSLHECPVESSPLFLLHKKGKNSSKPKTDKQVNISTVHSSQLPSRSVHTAPDMGALWNLLSLTCVSTWKRVLAELDGPAHSRHYSQGSRVNCLLLLLVAFY